MLSEKNALDKLLLSANTTALVAFFFVFQAPIDTNPTKWTLLISFTLFIFSELMFLWFLYRFPIRMKILNGYREKTVKKFSKRIGMFIEEILVPFTRLKAKDEMLSRLAEVSSEKEHKALMASIDKEIKELEEGNNAPKTPEEEEATKYAIEGFLDQLATASKADYNKAFHQPLNETYAKLKLRLDRLTFRFRRHIFISATVFAFFSIFIEILSK